MCIRRRSALFICAQPRSYNTTHQMGKQMGGFGGIDTYGVSVTLVVALRVVITGRTEGHWRRVRTSNALQLHHNEKRNQTGYWTQYLNRRCRMSKEQK